MDFGRFLDVIRAFEDIESEIVTLEDTRVRVATPAMLVKMKRGTIRPIDRADAEALAKMFRIEGV